MRRWIKRIDKTELKEILAGKQVITKIWEEELSAENVLPIIKSSTPVSSPMISSFAFSSSVSDIPQHHPLNQTTNNKIRFSNSKKINFEQKSQQLALARKKKIEKKFSTVEIAEKEEVLSKQLNMDTPRKRNKKEFHPLLLDVWVKSNRNLNLGKPIYEPELKSFWLRVHMFGRKCFNFFSNLFHGPSHSTVLSWINESRIYRWSDYLKVEKIPMIIQYYKEKGDLLPATTLLSIDAMKVDEDLCIDHTGRIDGLVQEKFVKNPNIFGEDQTKYTHL